MWLWIGEILVHLIAGLMERLDRSKPQPRMVECLRCGNQHAGVRCPACRYVFRIQPDLSRQ